MIKHSYIPIPNDDKIWNILTVVSVLALFGVASVIYFVIQLIN